MNIAELQTEIERRRHMADDTTPVRVMMHGDDDVEIDRVEIHSQPVRYLGLRASTDCAIRLELEQAESERDSLSEQLQDLRQAARDMILALRPIALPAETVDAINELASEAEVIGL